MTTYTFYDHIPAQAKYIREEVFVKEQGFHNEFDEIDSRAIHLVIFVEGQAAGTARMFLGQEGDTAFTVGRVAVLPQYRGLHLGNQMLALLEEKARELGAVLSPGAASELVERCGTDLFALESELSKLAAVADYGEITPELIAQMGTQSIEADVFEMVRLVTARNKTRAMAKLSQLLELQNEPIAIAAALSGSFVDMYRVKCGAAAHRNYAAVHKDFSYRGSDYRLRKSGETASHYSRAQLEHILSVLLGLDAALKSSAADGTVLLQTALCEVMQIGERR